ncbi:MAG: NfeD family protein, partial [Chloroflexota bacterium]
ALVLFNSPGTPQIFQVSIPLVVISGMLSAASFIAIMAIVIRAQKTPIQMGQTALIGRTGTVKSAIPVNGLGKVHMRGELWTAELMDNKKPIKDGERVEVIEVEGLRIKVRKIS